MDAASPDPLTTADRLRAAGLRATRPRRLVLDAVERLGGHRSADDVLDALRGDGAQLSRQGVYDALDALVGAGLVVAADVGHGSARYEPAATAHHHFVCRVCGAVSDVDGPTPRLAVPGALIESASVLLGGVCAGCRTPHATTGPSLAECRDR